MKSTLVAVVAALVALLLSAVALSREQRARQDLERRLAVLEAERVPAEPRAAPEPAATVPGNNPPAEPALPAKPAPPVADDPRLRKLEEQLARLELRVRELNRAAEGAAVEEVAGLPADQLWQKAQMAIQDRLNGRADALLREYLKPFPGDAHASEALLSLGGNAMKVGDMAAAAGYYDRLVKEFPDSKQLPFAEFYLGMSLIETGDLAGGREHYERSVEKFAGNSYWQAAALLNLGTAYIDKGQPEVAKDYLRRVSTQFAGDDQVEPLVKQANDLLKGMEGR